MLQTANPAFANLGTSPYFRNSIIENFVAANTNQEDILYRSYLSVFPAEVTDV
jgi:hypothetical protein